MGSISSNDQIEYLFHHLFLPPKLPGGDDMSAPNTIFLANFVLQTLQRFAIELGEKDTTLVQPVISMLQTMPVVTGPKGLDHVGVQKALQCLSFDNPVALFHIAAQNAGLLIRKSSNSFCFETFELSPTNAAVMATKGRLIRQFPDTATEIASEDFENQAFQEVLANTLVKMSHQRVSEAQPKARKAGKDHHEDRETTGPRIVTELLTSILRGIGKLAKVNGICKNTREEISYSSSNLPWRRSPVWLLIRVGLQLTMSRLSGGSDDIYKRFMVYLMAQVLLRANQALAPSEMLHIMMTKISCRLCKLEGLRNDKWLSTVRDVVSAASKNLKERWERICNHSEKQLDIASLSLIKMKDHLLFSIPEIDNFLASISHRGSNNDTSTFSPIAHVSCLNADSLPVVRTPSDDSYVQFNLAMIESWVQYNLNQWIEKHLHEESVCASLKVLLESYHSAARACYSTRPEAASRMLLTIGEIWIATDKATLHNYPMLREYDAEVPTEIWQALLLQSKADMIRLQRLETYLMDRKRTPSKPSVFRSFGDSMSFPVRYFQQSPILQSKKVSIEERAELDKQAKIKEFNHLKDRYNDLMQQYNTTTCREIYQTVLGVRYPIHDPCCHRCSLADQASSLQIMVHEWPLPTKTLEAQATVFELGIPHQFAEWRDVTFYFIHDVLSFKSFGERPDSSYPLDSYSGLSPWYNSDMSRVHLLSGAKPHLQTHRRHKYIAVSEVSDVYLDNGLVYRYFDRASGSFISPFTQSMAVSNLCTFKLPERAQALQPFLVRSWLQPDGETPNQVIASQSKCPRYMTLGEYKALTILPYGYRLPWMSILTQLAMPTLDFNQDETAIFLLQVSLQAGPMLASEATREAHTRLTDVEFGCRLLETLSQAVSRIEKNWESHTALCSFTLLTIRFLSLASPQLSQDILGLLCHCRSISYQWLTTLIRKIQDTVDDMQRRELLESALNVAMICVQTFHVDDNQLEKILRDSQQASLLVESSIIIQNTTLANNETQSPFQSIMEDRTKYTLHRTQRFLVNEVIYRGNWCLDLAIKRSWPDFSRTTEWSTASSTCYWLETNSGRRQVHLNLLTGELLVNGAPLTRLPRDYNMHEDYGRLFGSMILDVMPSDAPGMRFSATRDLQDYTVHFGMQEQDLLVQLHKPGSTLDLIPSRLLKGTVPYQFSDNFSHWYHRETKSIEFCKIHKSWALDDQRNWRFIRDEGHWKLGRHGGTFLVAPSSELATQIAEIFNPLEAPLGLHLVYSTAKSDTEIQIPSLRLEFLLRSGESFIESRQFRDMHVDPNQSIGTLMGLKSKLVLSSSREPPSRTILIPEGDVQHEMHTFNHIDKHTMVRVVHGSARRVQAYKLDGLLGRLVGSTKTESKLYLAYLHGLTSFCLPDPFIGRTGTEEALDILRSAIVRVTSILTETSYGILHSISTLSPKRSFYPRNEKVMQVVGWSSRLSYVSQDDRFYRAVCNLLAGSREISFLHPKREVPDSPDFSSVHLVERAINRASRGHVAGFGAEEFTTQHDVRYNARTQEIPSDRGIRAQEIAYRIYHSQCYIIETVDPSFAQVFYQLLSSSKVFNSSQIPPKSMMQYDSKWFQKPESFLASDWCKIHYAFHRKQDWLNKFELMAWMATVSYSSHHNPQITQALLMIAQCSSVLEVPLPEEYLYDLSEGCTAIAKEVRRLTENEVYPIASCPEASLPYSRGESPQQLVKRRERRFKENKRHVVDTFVDRIISQWPCPALRTPSEGTVDTYLRCKNVMASLYPKWDSWYMNWKFKEYLQEISDRLREVPVRGLKLEPQPERVTISPPSRRTGFISIEDLFYTAVPQSTFGQIPKPDVLLRMTKTDSRTVKKLTEVIISLEIQAKLPYEHRYLNDLRQSLLNLSKRHDQELDLDQRAILHPLFKQNLEDCTKHAKTVYQYLSRAIIDILTRKPGVQVLESVKLILEDSSYLPRVTPLLLLQQLRSSRFSCLPERWKVAIIEYATAISATQRAKRLVRFESNPMYLLREVQNPGHEAWEAWDHPEWLLLECESEIMIRNVQQQIAQKMINPPKGENAVMQLNMGEGKSTVIVPMVATALADGSKIIRVIVAKPQAKQMHRMLVSKLSGLLDRPVYLLPFSRDIRMNTQRAEAIHRLVTRCRNEGGVLMVQPEHLLSLQLMELECHLSSNKEAAERLTSIRELFDHGSRDIVDESDENFSAKFELIYTLGHQCSIEDSPSRWVVIQEVLGLVAQIAGEAKSEFSKSLEFDDRNNGRYPIVRFLQADAGEVVLDRIANRICKTGMCGFPISNQPEKIRSAVYRYITRWKLKKVDTKLVETSLFFDGAAIGRILLLRGLFSGGILAFALGQKRWRVNYGIDPHRETGTKLAVPFRAKDSPTPRSEFSHPDVVITLTCLSYYYGGLDEEALFSAFSILTKSDNARVEYHEWTRTAPSLPSSFRTLEGVNLRDRAQFKKEIYPHLCFSKSAIDYYLSHLVFSKEAKEFPHKLSASGWDLAKIKDNPTTGFSGTNDSRYVLPTDIIQLDLPEQKHTNALVLSHLLQSQNGVALVPQEAKGTPFNSRMLLDMISGMNTQTRVILDVGAQVIDLTNLEFAKQWLARYQDDDNTQAVVCFNEDDEIIVLDRSGKVEELETSPFAEHMDRCLVFLDESHTRGTDLKLPPNYRAVVTLGAGLTKDRLVQACMRMRKLGKGQSVEFCVPWEIEQKIIRLKLQEKAARRGIAISDVLSWVITETCLDLRKAIPLWLNQGVRFSRHQVFWSKRKGDAVSRWAEQFLEEEAQTLDQRYRPRASRITLDSLLDKAGALMTNELRARCDEFGLTELHTASLQEEQERELSPETEQERQVEKPPAAEPETHFVSQSLKDWILKGSSSIDITLFQAEHKPAFQTLNNTSAAQYFNVQAFPSTVRATLDFAKTVKGTFGARNYSDCFQRPVQWIMTNKCQAESVCLVIISPFEAQELLPLIERSQHVTLHLYAPRVNLAFQSLDHLQLYRLSGKPTLDATPRSVVTFLNLFSGQLYLSSFQDYTDVCDLLGLAWDAADESVILGPDGFIPPGVRGSVVNKSVFSQSPVQFLRLLMEKIRQDCGSIEKTDIGKIFEGMRLLEDDFKGRS
ncbi:uncharacterized protein BKA55DRAFT_695504 [Fusarium redolens]|uniref:ubiquitinyl hydrolase 1 n=1 Tax=Fusarium redolens TaxID=48865 RepID=A0A9P9G7K5_FUSRE|nr:uncharacterized protein BKA55DRAFT_695504 [Fusarium redolens]KAH7233986.1 hypothetical protein BKA55DRAFT_695504 [Fusarium redolens]